MLHKKKKSAKKFDFGLINIFSIFGQIAEPQNWTKSAVECYLIGGQCQICPVYKIIKDKCKMKGTVLMLVRKLGKPTVQTLSQLTQEEVEEYDG